MTADAKLTRTYRLKLMVIVRIIAEMGMLSIFMIMPFILHALQKVSLLPLPGKIVLYSFAVVSLFLLPFYGLITWKVKADDEGITAFSAFSRNFVAWQEIKRLMKKSNWNSPRYVVEGESSELSFPVWLESLDELVELIRERLPQKGSVSDPYRKFKQDPLSIAFQFAQALVGILIAVVFWFFFAAFNKSAGSSQFDSVILLAFCIILTIALSWRTYMIVLMPLSVELTRQDVTIRTCLFERKLPWMGVLKVGPSLPLLPEGFVIKTREGSFLVGNGMDFSDELEKAMADEIEAHHPKSESEAERKHRK